MRRYERRGRRSGGSRVPGGEPRSAEEQRPRRASVTPHTLVGGDPRLDALPRSAEALPSLPAAYDDALDDVLRPLELRLPAGAREAIDAHVRLLLAWNAAINLTAITDPVAVAVRHVADSLAALPLLAEARSIVDLGSGGGFPGLVLAAALPEARVTLVDSVRKKAAFLDAAARAAGVASRVDVAAERAEALAGGTRRWQVVTARAVASLPDLVELALPLLEPGGRLVAWKRGDIAAEIGAAEAAAAALGGSAPALHRVGGADLADHVLVEVRKVGRTPPAYPRDPVERRRHPW